MKKIFYISLLLILIKIQLFAQSPYINGNFDFLIDSLRDYSGVPLITDLDKNGQKEIIIVTGGATNFALNVIKSDMTEYSNFPKYYNAPIYDIASGDVNGDGDLDIAIKFLDSITVIDRFGNNLPGFPVSITNGASGSLSFISLYDLDNDGRLEIITPSSRKLWVINYNGQIRSGWPKNIAGTSNTAPAIGDIDNDGFAEIIYPSFVHLSSPPYNDSSAITIFRHDGTYYSNDWPKYLDSNYISFGASPSLYIDKYNISNSYFVIPNSRAITPNTYLNRLNKYNFYGQLLARTYEITDDELGTLTIGDVNNDGMVEFAAGSQQYYYLTLFSNNLNIMPGWPQNGQGEFHVTPVIGKLTSSMNIFSTTPGYVYGFAYAYNANGSMINNFPLRQADQVRGSSIADLNNDGSVELIMATQHFGKVYLQIITFPNVPFSFTNDPWPQFGHDRYRTNQYGFIPPDEIIGITPIGNIVPDKFALKQNYPNPFNPETQIEFSIPYETNIKLIVYDALGKEIKKLADNKIKAGNYRTSFDGTNFASGVYYLSLITNKHVITSKMILLK